MATPLEISIALHYWTRTTDYGADAPDYNIDAPAVVTQRQMMIDAGLLALSHGSKNTRYVAGPALKCYIDALCSLPWPEQRWVMPDAA